ncbi:MAG: ribonuclease P protein component [bacterium]
MHDGEKAASGSQPSKHGPPAESVRGRRAIDNLFRTGKRLNGKQITLIYNDRTDGSVRFSIFVPRRLGGPVRRNRARRVLREFIRTHPHPAMDGREIIILCKQPIDSVTLKKAGEELSRLLSRLAGDKKQCRPVSQ